MCKKSSVGSHRCRSAIVLAPSACPSEASSFVFLLFGLLFLTPEKSCSCIELYAAIRCLVWTLLLTLLGVFAAMLTNDDEREYAERDKTSSLSLKPSLRKPFFSRHCPALIKSDMHAHTQCKPTGIRPVCLCTHMHTCIYVCMRGYNDKGTTANPALFKMQKTNIPTSKPKTNRPRQIGNKYQQKTAGYM